MPVLIAIVLCKLSFLLKLDSSTFYSFLSDEDSGLWNSSLSGAHKWSTSLKILLLESIECLIFSDEDYNHG